MAAFHIEHAGPGRATASGELGFATAAEALGAGLRLIGTEQSLTADLAGVTAGDSAGLAVLVEWLSVARERGVALRYANVPTQIVAIARISDLEELLLGQPG